MNREIFKKFLLNFVFSILFFSVSYAEEVKISIGEEGIYVITKSDLINAGLNLTGVDPGTIKIINRGAETPISVTGAEDGTFDAEDYIEFYGVAVRKGDPDYDFTETNTYWLKTGGEQGQRVQSIDGTLSGGGTIPREFSASLHLEKNTDFFQTIPNGNGVDHWYWGKKIKAPESRDYTFELDNISTSAPTPTVRVKLYGKTDDQGKSPNHHTRIEVNGCLLSEETWTGKIPLIHTNTENLPITCFKEGGNTVRLNSIGVAGTTVDKIFLDWIEVDYNGLFVAKDDSLLFSFSTEGTIQFRISNFSVDQEVMVFDITSKEDVKRIVNNATESGVTTFEATLSGERKFIALTGPRRKSPLAIEPDTPSNLKSHSNQADYIMITYDDFYDSILPLADHHSSNGLEVKIVKISNVYDEFNYGIPNPRAIKEFLKYAYNNWQPPAPLYVLLVGDANMDIKDNFNAGNKSFIPTHYIEAAVLGYVPSDNWFVSVSGKDFLPDMFLGRIPAKTRSDVSAVVNKITGYANSAGSPWSTTVQLVADYPDEDNDRSNFNRVEDLKFENLSDDIVLNHFSPKYSAKKVYLSKSDSNTARAEIISNLNEGVLITNYTGHGSQNRWAQNLFSTDDVSRLNNQNNLTFMIMLNCLNGFFALPMNTLRPSDPNNSLGEQFLLEPEKGAIASFASSTAGYFSEHSVIAKALFDTIMTSGKTILGEATTEAKIISASSGATAESLNTFVLLGDPALDLKEVQSGQAAVSGSGNIAAGSEPEPEPEAETNDNEKGGGGGGCFINTAKNYSSQLPTDENQLLRDGKKPLLLFIFVLCFSAMRVRKTLWTGA